MFTSLLILFQSMEYIANIVPHDMFSEYTYRTAILGPRPVLVNLMPIKVYFIAGWELFRKNCINGATQVGKNTSRPCWIILHKNVYHVVLLIFP